MKPFRFFTILRIIALSLCLSGTAAQAQPTGPDGGPPHIPDISTIPGAVTLPANQFDLEGSDFILEDGTWLAIDPEKGTQASLSFKAKVPGGKYTFALDTAVEQTGTSSFWIQVGDQKLAPKRVPIGVDTLHGGKSCKLMWPEITFPINEDITIHAEISMKDGSPASHARWSRLVLISHSRLPTYGGPPSREEVAPEPPRTPPAMTPKFPTPSSEESQKNGDA